MDSNQYAIELVTYLLVLVIYFYELIVYILLDRNAFDSIAFFSQCRLHLVLIMEIFFFIPSVYNFSTISQILKTKFYVLIFFINLGAIFSRTT